MSWDFQGERRDRLRAERRAEWAPLPATDQQRSYIAWLIRDGAIADPPATLPMTRGDAADYIERLRAGRPRAS